MALFDRLPADAAPPSRPSRRALLQVGAAVGGGLLVGFLAPVGKAARAEDSPAQFAPNAFIRIDRAGKVTLVMPQVEMGQGVYTSISMILAEELDADWSQVGFEHAPPSDALYANPVFGLQVTGNSNSIRAFWTPLRKAGAATRAMLVQAAAAGWGVDPAACRTEASQVIHDASARRIAYGDLVDRAAALTPPADPPLKAVKDFRLIGKPLKRLDTPAKVDGSAQYGIDALPDGVKFATLAHSPVFGGKVAHVDDSQAKAVPGVRQVVVLDDLVAVVGDHMWAAKQGLAALDITWDEGPNAGVDTAQVTGPPEGRQRPPGRGGQVGRRHRQGALQRRGRGDLPGPVPGPRHHGADELHGPCDGRRLRDLGRHPGDVPRPGLRRPGHRPAAGQGHRPQPPDRRRLRPAAGGRPGLRGRAHRPAGGRPGQGGLDAARRTSSTTSTGPPGTTASAPSSTTAGSTAGSTSSPAPRCWRAGCRRRSSGARTSTPGTAPRTCPTTSPTSTWNTSARSRRACRPASGAAWGRRTTSSSSRASSTSWRTRPARTRWPSALACWTRPRACRPR